MLVPACSRKVEPGMVVQTDSERVRHSRAAGARVPRLVGRPVARRPTSPAASSATAREPERFGPPAPPAEARATPRPGTTTRRDGATRRDRRPAGEGRQRPLRPRLRASASSATSASRPAASDAQNTFAIAVAGRGFDARISTEFDVPLPDSACVYCGNCIGVCPTGALMFKSEHDLRAGRARGTRRGRRVTDTICPYCGVGCTLDAARAGQRDREGHLAARPRRDARQPLHQGPLRLAVRAEPRPQAG